MYGLSLPGGDFPGCTLEHDERLIRMLGLLFPLAVRLLPVRDLLRQAPECPAHSVIGPDTLKVLAAHVGISPSTTMVGTDRSHC